jgi:hypothetical protein
MRQHTAASPFLIFAIGVTVFGLLTTLIVAIYPPARGQSLECRKVLVGSVFSMICILGIVATFSPKRCAEALHMQGHEGAARRDAEHGPSNETSLPTKGHHVNCRGFSHHVLRIRGKTLCAACTGMFAGATTAIAVSLVYFSNSIVQPPGLPTLFIGQTGIVTGLIQFRFKGWIRSGANAFFVIGALLTLMGVDIITENLLVDAYLIALIVFWLLTRILISRWDHSRICSECKLPCET